MMQQAICCKVQEMKHQKHLLQYLDSQHFIKLLQAAAKSQYKSKLLVHFLLRKEYDFHLAIFSFAQHNHLDQVYLYLVQALHLQS